MPTALVSVDFEGLPYIVSPKHQLGPDGRLWQEARRIATRLTRIVVEELIDLGYRRVIVADSHGLMVNLEPELPRGVMLVQGFPRPAPARCHSSARRLTWRYSWATTRGLGRRRY